MLSHTTPEQRMEFYRRHRQGETYPEIAAWADVSVECVRYWCRRQRDGGSSQSCYPGRPRGLLQEFNALVRYWILRLRLQHPGWGVGSLRSHLKKQPSLSGKRLPAPASMGRYLHQWSRFHRKGTKKPVRVRPQQPTQVHECWQIDFKVAIPLSDGRLVDLHTVRDPFGEVCIAAVLYRTELVKVHTGKVPMEQVRATLRSAFAHWNTLPNCVQTDGEACLSPSREDGFPSTFSLWLKGLDIEHRLIRPGKPTDNAEVERCHRTLNEYALLGNEDNPLPNLQALLDQAIFELAYELPSRAEGCAGKTPIQAHPDLLQPRRTFCAQEELVHFDLKRVDTYLATFTWQRKVSHSGQICIGGHHHYYTVGHAYAGSEVLVRFDPSDRHFVFFGLHSPEKEVGRRPAHHLEVDDLTGYSTFPHALLPQQLPLPLFQGVISL